MSFVILFCSIGGALWILIADGIAPGQPEDLDALPIAVIVQNACIFLSA